jgi:Tfp pilus assembly protein PilO
MNQPWSVLKKWITGAIVALFLLDFGLVYISWQSSPEAVQALREQRDRLETQYKKLKGDVERGDRIKTTVSKGQQDYDSFYKATFLSSQDGYSSIEADLTQLASKAGLRTVGIQFEQKEVKGRGVTDVGITESVEGNYNSVVQFINGLERSKYFYLLKDLKLDLANGGQGVNNGTLRLHLELHTYFRT